MTHALSKATVDSWIALNRAQRATFDRMQEALKAEGFPALEWYDVLLELWRAPERRLRQSEIQRRTLFAQYNVSRLIDRLEGAGLVRREPCPEDARARTVGITDEGLRLREAMWVPYSAAISKYVGAKLTEAEAAALAGLLTKLDGRP